MKIIETKSMKFLRSEDYNYNFDKRSGYFERWGETKEEDPILSPFGPEIADIELSTICHQGCKFCYKSNTSSGKNMDLTTFKQLFSKLPRTLTQIAFGIGDIDSNPDLWEIMFYCRNNTYQEVIPNITVNGSRLKDTDILQLANLCGAVAVSHYNDSDCFSTVRRLSDAGLKQVNIHQLLSEDTFEDCVRLMRMAAAKEIPGLNAIVFLLLKPKGRGKKLTQLRDIKKYEAFIQEAVDKGAPIGFDSCSAGSFLRVISTRPKEEYDKLFQLVEPCESNLFSIYIDVEGHAFHCSFSAGEPGWKGVDVLNCKDFLSDVWCSPEVRDFRSKLLANNRECFIHDLKME